MLQTIEQGQYVQIVAFLILILECQEVGHGHLKSSVDPVKRIIPGVNQNYQSLSWIRSQT